MLPVNFQAPFSNMKDFTKANIDVLPDSSVACVAGSTTRFQLPYGSTTLLSKFCLHFTAALSAYTTDSNGRKLKHPKYASSYIKRLTVYVNGQIISQIDDYNKIYNIIKDFKQTSDHDVVLANASPDITEDDTDMDFIITDWIGLLDTDAVVDTNSLGNVVIEIVWASNDVIMNSGAGTAASNAVTFSIDNIKLSMDRMNLGSDYYSALSSSLSSSPKRILFDHYQIFKNGNAGGGGSVRFNANSQSIKYALGGFEPNGTGQPMQHNAKINNSSYFNRSSTAFASANFTVGSTKLPANPMNKLSAYANTYRLFGEKNGTLNGMTRENWDDSMTVPLSLEYSEQKLHEPKLDSGLSTENLPIGISFDYTTSGAFTNHSAFVVLATQRVLEISNGQQVTIDI